MAGENRIVPRAPRGRRKQGVQRPVQPRAWVSWANFVLEEMLQPEFFQEEAEEFVVNQMEHVGSIYGIPKAAGRYKELLDIPERMDAKRRIAQKVVSACLELAKIEVWQRIKYRIEKGGVGVLQRILDNGSILDEVMDPDNSGSNATASKGLES